MARKGEIVAVILRQADGNDVWTLGRITDTRRAVATRVLVLHGTGEPEAIQEGTLEVLSVPGDQAVPRHAYMIANRDSQPIRTTGALELRRILNSWATKR
jgi:hypothetical protein